MFEQPSQVKYEWLVLALIYNHKHYDELYGKLPGYRTMENQKCHLFHAVEDIAYHPKIKIVLVENRLSFVEQNNTIVGVNEVINIATKTEKKEWKQY